MLDIHVLPILNDNYAFVIQSAGVVGIIDPGEAAPFIGFLEKKGWRADYVINTHHHGDHTNGNQTLIDRFGAKWAAPSECGKVDIVLEEGTPFVFGGTSFDILETPGHTKGHVCLYNEQSQTLFSGDTVFAMGCGRIFEGTAEDMFGSMRKIKSLPWETKIYFGHDYTAANAKFASHILPDNDDIAYRVKNTNGGQGEIPTRLDVEMKTNPFLLAQTADEFAAYRAAKDAF